ncbi:uncharacterized protein [Pseudorasbora parva]|uniref:uncharacterized protein n=1 Tax=Pseudorasbora parva TaxID=51549 RepID=UPI00351EDD72
MRLSLFLLLIYGVSELETDETEFKSVSAMEGGSVNLATNLTEIQNDDTILWMFGAKDFLISHLTRKQGLTTFFATDDERFRGRLQVDQKTGSLTIRNTRLRHSGQYKLSISRKKTTIKIFNVTVSGVFVETDGVKSLSVTEGESVTLHNGAEMNKHDLILWRFGDKGLLLAKSDFETNETSLNDDDERFRERLKLDQTGSLTIKNTRTTDSGLYELQIRGTESLQQFLLSVEAIPDPQLSSGGKAGIGVGVLVPVLLLVAATFALIYFIRKLKKRMGQEKEETMTEGESPTLSTGLNEIQANDTIEWYYKDETNIIAKKNRETRKPPTMDGDDGRFRSKLRLDEKNGDLTISNIRTIHSGLYILKINNSSKSIKKNKYKRFIVTVNGKYINSSNVLIMLFSFSVNSK